VDQQEIKELDMPIKPYHHGDLKNALIQAGIDILAHEGVHGLSLRKVARQAGVSHAAPYSHFADKQGLIAAISTAGYDRIRESVERVSQAYEHDPLQLLVRTGWEYVQFALEDPDLFRITFSGVVEKEKDYPALVEAAQKSFGLFVQIVAGCQAEGILRAGPADLTALCVWASIHGILILRLDGQVSHTILENNSWQQMLIHALRQLSLVPIPDNILD
jgi:AcrR family transcriptional regulator